MGRYTCLGDKTFRFNFGRDHYEHVPGETIIIEDVHAHSVNTRGLPLKRLDPMPVVVPVVERVTAAEQAAYRRGPAAFKAFILEQAAGKSAVAETAPAAAEEYEYVSSIPTLEQWTEAGYPASSYEERVAKMRIEPASTPSSTDGTPKSDAELLDAVAGHKDAPPPPPPPRPRSPQGSGRRG